MKKLITLLYSLCTIWTVSAERIDPSLTFYVEDPEYYSHRIANDDTHLWIASYQGLIHYNKTTEEYVVANGQFSLPDTTQFLSVYKDREDKLWFCARHKNVLRWDGQTLSNYRAGWVGYPYLRHCYSMLFDPDNSPYLGSINGARYNYVYSQEDSCYYSNKYLYFNINSHIYIAVMDMKYDNKGDMWALISSRDEDLSAVFLSKNNQKGILFNQLNATSLTIDAVDNIWITTQKGLYCYQQASDTTIIYSNLTRSDVPEGRYVASDIDVEGNLWFSATNFLLKYDGKAFTHYTCDEYDEARSILCDGDVVWIYTNHDDIIRFEEGVFSKVSIIKDSLSVSTTVDQSSKVSCSRDGSLSIWGSSGVESVDVYDVQGVLINRTVVKGAESVTIPNVCSTKGTVYIVKIYTSDRQLSVAKIVR